ncbi:MAG: uridine kinase [Acidobacteriota bacterium]
MPNSPPVVLGVAGGTGSGKTTVARAILRAIGKDRLAFIAQDSYYRQIEWESPEHLASHNFDHPKSIDTELLIAHLKALKRREPVEAPVYDFVNHRRSTKTVRIEPRRVVLAEGILLLAEPGIRELLDFKIYVDTDSDVRLKRRILRDINERGRDLEDILRQYMTTVRPMHLEFVEPSKRWADVIVPEGGENRVALQMVAARVEELLRVSVE